VACAGLPGVRQRITEGCGISARDCRRSSLEMSRRSSRRFSKAGSIWPSLVNPIISWGMPSGNGSPRSTCQVCQVLP
jgi:hypothetical protein